MVIRCIQCGIDFKFTEGEQVFYQKHSYQPPKRCVKCRALRKRETATEWKKGEPYEGYRFK